MYLNNNLGGVSFKIENGILYWGERGADTWLPFNRRDWEIFASYGGIDPVVYEGHNEFMADTDAFSQVVKSETAIDYLLTNTELLTQYLNNTSLVPILVSSDYFVSGIKADEFLISLLLSNTATLVAIYSSDYVKKQTSAGTVDGIIIYVWVQVGGQFWGYYNGQGGGSAKAIVYANGASYVSVSASGSPSSDGNHTSYGNTSGKYNTTMTGLSNSFTLSVTGSADGGTEEHNGSMTIYYI